MTSLVTAATQAGWRLSDYSFLLDLLALSPECICLDNLAHLSSPLFLPVLQLWKHPSLLWLSSWFRFCWGYFFFSTLKPNLFQRLNSRLFEKKLSVAFSSLFHMIWKQKPNQNHDWYHGSIAVISVLSRLSADIQYLKLQVTHFPSECIFWTSVKHLIQIYTLLIKVAIVYKINKAKAFHFS